MDCAERGLDSELPDRLVVHRATRDPVPGRLGFGAQGE